MKLYDKGFGLLIVPYSDTIVVYFVECDASVVLTGTCTFTLGLRLTERS